MKSKFSILRDNEKMRLSLRLPWLICFAMFAAWQMGVIYFSGQTLSVDGRTSLPVNVDDVTILIIVGYVLSIAVIIFLPRIIVTLERILAITALVAVGALFLPLSPEIFTGALYVQFFCCCFMIGFETAIIVNLFRQKTAILHLTLAYSVAMVIVAALQNDFMPVPFEVFRAISVVMLVAMIVFFFRLPARISPTFVTRANQSQLPKIPRRMFAFVCLWVAVSCFFALFGSAIAETFRYGVTVFYASSAVYGFVIFAVWKRFGDAALFRFFSVSAAVGAAGYAVAMAASSVPALGLVAAVLLGAGSVACWINPLLGLLIMKRYPSRFITPVIIGVALLTLIIHALLLDLLRDNLTVLYTVYLVVAVSLVLLYLILEPYLSLSLRDSDSGDEKVSSSERENDIKGQLQAVAFTPLTPREIAVGEMTVMGIRRSVIAEMLDIKASTINSHRINLYNKIGVSNRKELLEKLKEVKST